MKNSFFTQIKGTIINSSFYNSESAFNHVAILVGSTAIAQAVGILTIPIISRIYSPSDYGIMAVYASVIAILVEISGFRYQYAIPLPKHDRDAKALFLLSLGLHIIFIFFLSLFLFFAGAFFLKYISMSELIPYRYMFPIGILVTGFYVMLMQWAIRARLFSSIARTKVTQSVSGALTKIILGFLGIRPMGLVIGTIVAQSGGITTLLSSLLKEKGLPRIDLADIRRVALRYRKFPMYNTWSGLLNTFGMQVVPILIVTYYSPDVAGLFAMAQSLLHLPSALAGEAVGQVFLQRASVARYKETLKDLSFRTYIFLLTLGFFPLLLISFFSPTIFSVILGERWIEAGMYARIIGPWIAYGFVYSPLSRLYSLLERQGIGLLFEIVFIISRISAFWLGAYFGNPLLSVGLFSLVSFLIPIVRMLDLLMAAGLNFKTVFFSTLFVMIEALFLILIPVAVMLLNFGTYPVIAAIFAVSIIYIVRNYKFLITGGAGYARKCL